MIDLCFSYIAAENFLCFGPQGIEIDLTQYGNIVLIRGENMDVQEEDKSASNGVGKSSIPEIIVYTLFGKSIKQPKKLTHNNVINNKVGKKLRTEVRWDKYRVVRTRKPDSLRLWESPDGDWGQLGDEKWEDDHEISLGGMPATQKEIEDKIGLNYQNFVNVVVFTDNNAGSFLECDLPAKRQIVENLLSLDRYRQYSDSAKRARNEFKDTIKLIGKGYEHLLVEEKASQNRVTQVKEQENDWVTAKKQELDTLIKQIEVKNTELQSTDVGNAMVRYREAQEEIATIDVSIVELDSGLSKVKGLLDKAQIKLQETNEEKNNVNNGIQKYEMVINMTTQDIVKNEATIKSYEDKKDTTCPTCLGTVVEENYRMVVDECIKVIENKQKEIQPLLKVIVDEKAKITECETVIKNLKEGIKSGERHYKETSKKLDVHREKRGELDKIEKPEGDVYAAVLTKQIDGLLEQKVSKEQEINGPSPYVAILKSTESEVVDKQKECVEKKAELLEAEKELPYYEFWVTAFGDTGIRKFVIDGIIPALNSRISYWLQFLIDGKISLLFDNQLEETIERNPSDGDPFVYYAMSGGERRRLNLSVSQAFAHVMMLNSGASPSLVFLDEVTTNIDPIGVQGVYNMIAELANHKQVFVTTHDRDLLDILSGCESINLKKLNGFTTLV